MNVWILSCRIEVYLEAQHLKLPSKGSMYLLLYSSFPEQYNRGFHGQSKVTFLASNNKPCDDHVTKYIHLMHAYLTKVLSCVFYPNPRFL